MKAIASEDRLVIQVGPFADDVCRLRLHFNGVVLYTIPIPPLVSSLDISTSELLHEILENHIPIDREREDIGVLRIQGCSESIDKGTTEECFVNIVIPSDLVRSITAQRSSTPTESVVRNATSTTKRQCAGTLWYPGEKHSWRLSVDNLLNGELSSLLYARVVFEAPQIDPLAIVRWSYGSFPKERAQVESPPVSKRSRSHVTSTDEVGQTYPTSVFPVLAIQGETINCEIEWPLYLGSAGAPKRYAVYVEKNTEPPPMCAPASIGGKRVAVLVGISKYTRKRNGDLEYADDDIVYWWKYLTKQGYTCRVFGDEFSPYPQWDGPGTVINVRNAVRAAVDECHSPNDHLIFVTSSHGNGNGRGDSYLCLLPDPFVGKNALEREGKYLDRHLAEDLSCNGLNKARTFIRFAFQLL